MKSPIILSALLWLFALSPAARADVSIQVPATVSGGDINSVVLQFKFTVQACGYSGTKAILVNGVSTGIVPSNGDTGRTASMDIASYGLICVHLTAGIFRIVI